MSDCPRLPPILRLPSELHIHILSFLKSEVPKCCLTGFALEPYKARPSWYDRASPKIDHDASSDHDTETVTVAHPVILLLRSTHPYFYTLIQPSQSLLLQILRHRSTPRPKLGPLRDVLGACCVCLRLRPSHEFAIDAPSATSATHQSTRNHALWTLRPGARYRFCRDCGFRAYPHPHPALPPRRQQDHRGNAPVGMTTYRPGTKVVSIRWCDEAGLCYVSWTWCLDCGLLKTAIGLGDAACSVFCQECCVRLECGLELFTQQGARMLRYLHRGYAGIGDEIAAETRRREHRLNTGAVFVAQGRSMLFKNVEKPVVDGEDREENDRLEDAVWRAWFDLEGFPAVNVTPPSDWTYLPNEPLRNSMPMDSTACCFTNVPTSHSVEPWQWCIMSSPPPLALDPQRPYPGVKKLFIPNRESMLR